MPDTLTVRRVEERNSVATIVERTLRDPLAISFSLRQHALWPEGQFLSLDDTNNPAIDAEGIVRWAVVGSKLFNSATLVGREWCAGTERNNSPSRRFQLRVDQSLTCKPLGIAGRCRIH